MDQTEKKMQNHLDKAKKELKNAAESALELTKADLSVGIAQAKEKVNEVVANVAASVGAAADKVHEEVTKKDPVVKK
ncbi:MAG: hypothetical protein Q7R42_01645 [Candidatus Planktophila sp.]|nr:hypothetical protein [Candidatus Planktophila sp.]